MAQHAREIIDDARAQQEAQDALRASRRDSARQRVSPPVDQAVLDKLLDGAARTVHLATELKELLRAQGLI